MKSTYLCGYYGMQNSGDDALLWATINGARSYLNAEHFAVNTPQTVYVPDSGKYRAKLRATPRYRGENRLLQCYNAVLADQIIFGGGSVLHCKRDMDTKCLMMKLAGSGPHLALGVGIETFEKTEDENACKRFLNRCDYVGVRDQASYEIATSLAPNANIELTFDLAPSLLPQLERHLTTSPIDDANPPVRRGIGVTLCPRESIQKNASSESLAIEKQRIKDLAIGLANIHRETGEPIFIFDMNGHQELGDKSVHDMLENALPINIPVFRYAYQSNPIRLIREMSRLKLTVAMRLHGNVFSYLADTPVMAINYHNKCDGWCDQIGQDKNYRFSADGIDTERFTQTAINGIYNGFTKCHLSLQDAFKASLKNFVSPGLDQSKLLAAM